MKIKEEKEFKNNPTEDCSVCSFFIFPWENKKTEKHKTI
jgi:hypothetical protein